MSATLAQRIPNQHDAWPLLASIDLGKLPEAVPLARQYVTYMLGEWFHLARLAENAKLITSELISNSICHGEPPLTLILSANSERLLIESWDGSHRPPTPHNITPATEYGRGLTVVNALADDWGWFAEPAGKAVWAML